ncbi:MAG: hypothetical protein M1837_002896 [Sclerophora amabilis]|nr:MAG: hypothetical protein M1837_002896 [Sclerophora amabilis]
MPPSSRLFFSCGLLFLLFSHVTLCDPPSHPLVLSNTPADHITSPRFRRQPPPEQLQAPVEETKAPPAPRSLVERQTKAKERQYWRNQLFEPASKAELSQASIRLSSPEMRRTLSTYALTWFKTIADKKAFSESKYKTFKAIGRDQDNRLLGQVAVYYETPRKVRLSKPEDFALNTKGWNDLPAVVSAMIVNGFPSAKFSYKVDKGEYLAGYETSFGSEAAKREACELTSTIPSKVRKTEPGRTFWTRSGPPTLEETGPNSKRTPFALDAGFRAIAVDRLGKHFSALGFTRPFTKSSRGLFHLGTVMKRGQKQYATLWAYYVLPNKAYRPQSPLDLRVSRSAGDDVPAYLTCALEDGTAGLEFSYRPSNGQVWKAGYMTYLSNRKPSKNMMHRESEDEEKADTRKEDFRATEPGDIGVHNFVKDEPEIYRPEDLGPIDFDNIDMKDFDLADIGVVDTMDDELKDSPAIDTKKSMAQDQRPDDVDFDFDEFEFDDDLDKNLLEDLKAMGTTT